MVRKGYPAQRDLVQRYKYYKGISTPLKAVSMRLMRFSQIVG